MNTITSEIIEEATKQYLDKGGVITIVEPDKEVSKFILLGVDEDDYQTVQVILEKEANNPDVMNDYLYKNRKSANKFKSNWGLQNGYYSEIE